MENNKITDEKIIRHCFEKHVEDCGGNVKFTFEQYSEFWLQHNVGDKYRMVNKDGSYLECDLVYFPISLTYDTKLNKQREVVGTVLKNFKDLRALVEIKIENGFDFREVPIHFLEKIPSVVSVQETKTTTRQLWEVKTLPRMDKFQADLLSHYWDKLDIPEYEDFNVSKVFLDDLRIPTDIYPNAKKGDWTIIRTMNDFKWFIELFGVPKYISFDNDLGGPDEGKELVKWMTFEKMFDISEMEFIVHSANSSGVREYMEGTLNNWKKELLNNKSKKDE